MNNIWVTGNGFDLYHGLKTSWPDFVRRVEAAFSKGRDVRSETDVRFTELCNVNGFFRHFHFLEGNRETWSDFEEETAAIVDAMARFEDAVITAQRDPEYDLTAYQIISGLFTYRDLKIFLDFARIFEQIFDDPSGGMFKLRQSFITPDKTLNVRAMADEVSRELDDFTRAMDLYLTENVMGTDTGVRLKDREAPDFVINMNFTDTARLYGVPDEHIFYSRGKAGSEPVNLVLGSPDEGEGQRAWIPLKNYFRKLTRFVGLPDWRSVYERAGMEISDPVTVTFIGYSFPAGDAELIKSLDTAAARFIVTYTDGADYAAKVLGLMDIFGKEWVVNNLGCSMLSFERV